MNTGPTVRHTVEGHGKAESGGISKHCAAERSASCNKLYTKYPGSARPRQSAPGTQNRVAHSYITINADKSVAPCHAMPSTTSPGWAVRTRRAHGARRRVGAVGAVRTARPAVRACPHGAVRTRGSRARRSARSGGHRVRGVLRACEATRGKEKKGGGREGWVSKKRVCMVGLRGKANTKQRDQFERQNAQGPLSLLGPKPLREAGTKVTTYVAR